MPDLICDVISHSQSIENLKKWGSKKLLHIPAKAWYLGCNL